MSSNARGHIPLIASSTFTTTKVSDRVEMLDLETFSATCIYTGMGGTVNATFKIQTSNTGGTTDAEWEDHPDTGAAHTFSAETGNGRVTIRAAVKENYARVKGVPGTTTVTDMYAVGCAKRRG